MTLWNGPGCHGCAGQIQARLQIRLLLLQQRKESPESGPSESLGPDGNEIHQPSASLYLKEQLGFIYRQTSSANLS